VPEKRENPTQRPGVNRPAYCADAFTVQICAQNASPRTQHGQRTQYASLPIQARLPATVRVSSSALVMAPLPLHFSAPCSWRCPTLPRASVATSGAWASRQVMVVPDLFKRSSLSAMRLVLAYNQPASSWAMPSRSARQRTTARMGPLRC
jgi:hypothetical protein